MPKAMGTRKKTVQEDNTDVQTFICPHCGKEKPKKSFYVSTDPAISIGIAFPCKDCAEKIARNYNERTKMFGDCTEGSIKAALEYLDKPFLKDLYQSSYGEVHDATLERPKTNLWAAYIKNVTSLKQYNTKRWRDGDFDNIYSNQNTSSDNKEVEDQEFIESYKKNKKAVIDFIGWDPYKDYPTKEDLPILYAQLLNFLDEETKNDGMKLNAVIQICKAFNQVEKLNTSIDTISSDPKQIISNATLLKSLQEAAAKALASATTLAKDNVISVNYNNNKSKGAHTLSGKMKKMYDIGLREAKINTYDIGTCEGMKQVALINEEARHAQIGYDENIAQEIKDIKVDLVEQMTKERDEAVEIARKLLLENKDLKDFLLEKGLVNENYEVIEDE